MSLHVEVLFEGIRRSPSGHHSVLYDFILSFRNRVLLNSNRENSIKRLIKEIYVCSEVLMMLIEDVISLMHSHFVLAKVIKACSSLNEHLELKFKVLRVPNRFLNWSPKSFVKYVLLFHSSIKKMRRIIELLYWSSLHGREILHDVISSESCRMVGIKEEEHVNQVLSVRKTSSFKSKVSILPSRMFALRMNHHIKQDHIPRRFGDRDLSDVLHVSKRKLLLNDLQKELRVLSHLRGERRKIRTSTTSSFTVELQ